MPASVSYDPQSIPLGRSSYAVVTYKYDPSQDDLSRKWTLLPNVRLLGIDAREGPDPWVARYRYSFGDPFRDPEDPQTIEQAMPLDATGLHVVQQDDQLVSCVLNTDGSHLTVNWGFAQAPQADIGEATEEVSFVTLGASVREYDEPLAGAVLRNADRPDAPTSPVDGSSNDVATGNLPARFNPDGKANATPKDADSGESPTQYPVFMGPFPENKITVESGDFVVRKWTLAMAARYVIRIGTTRFHVGQQDKTELSKYVVYDSLDDLETLLAAVAPKDSPGTDASLDDPFDPDGVEDWNDATFDPDNDPDDPGSEPTPSEAMIDTSDPDTYQLEDIFVQDLDVSAMPWPEALWRLLEPNGYGMGYVLIEKEPEDRNYPGDPEFRLDIYRKDFSTRQKSLSRQASGAQLDPGKTNLQSLSMSRDGTGIANRVALDCAPVRLEVGLVLALAEDVDDADVGNKNTFKKGDPGFVGKAKDKYRLLVFDECGEGHWDAAADEHSTEPGDLEPAFLLDRKEKYWATRRREPIGELLTKDDKKEPLRASLWVSYDYDGDSPGVWDGTGTWAEIQGGEWHLLDDRLGVYVNTPDPNRWKISGETTGPGLPPKGARIHMVEWFSPTDLTKPYPRFLLTCCVDLDDDINVSAEKRASSPTQFKITRRVDARERFRKHIRTISSKYAPEDELHDEVMFDETAEAQATADAYRRQTEGGTYAGTARIPRFTTAYAPGDQITDIRGRDFSLRTNGAGEQNESPVYPVVVGISWNFDGEQSTTLTLSDHRNAPPPRRGGRVKKTTGLAKFSNRSGG